MKSNKYEQTCQAPTTKQKSCQAVNFTAGLTGVLPNSGDTLLCAQNTTGSTLKPLKILLNSKLPITLVSHLVILGLLFYNN